MRYTNGSILSMTPASGVVRFVTEGETWDVPLVGWAIVIDTYTDPEDQCKETSIEPVLLDTDISTCPMTLRDYRENFAPGAWRSVEYFLDERDGDSS
jgi:hypothetical protein